MHNKPCLDCGELTTNGSYCETDAKAKRARERSRSYSRENSTYDHRWRKLSKRMREAQGFCSETLEDGTLCGATDDLTLDHSREAYERQAQGLALGVEHGLEVLCRSHNSSRGKQRE